MDAQSLARAQDALAKLHGCEAGTILGTIPLVEQRAVVLKQLIDNHNEARKTNPALPPLTLHDREKPDVWFDGLQTIYFTPKRELSVESNNLKLYFESTKKEQPQAARSDYQCHDY